MGEPPRDPTGEPPPEIDLRRSHLDIVVEGPDDGRALLRVSGELDGTGAELLEARVGAALAASPAAVVLDLGGTTFLDSLGLAALVTARQRVHEAGCTFALRAVGPECMRVLEITRLTDVFTIL